jgi:hypothetical protein
MDNVLSLPYLNTGVYPSPPISDPSLSRQYDFTNDRDDGFYDPPLSGEMLDHDFDLDDRDKRGKCDLLQALA